MDPTSDKTPLDALNKGAFQCDGSLGLAGFEDRYEIPTRVVGGYRAKKYKKGKENSFLVLQNDLHVWVEVYADGAWHTFDPTPIKRLAQMRGIQR